MSKGPATVTQPFKCDDCGAEQSTLFTGEIGDFVERPLPDGWTRVTTLSTGGAPMDVHEYCPNCKEKHR